MTLPKDPLKIDAYLVKLSEVNRGEHNPQYGRRGRKHPMFGKHHTDEWCENHSKSVRGEKHPMFGKHQSENSILKNIESNIGGFWYGNVRYRYPPKYCELWCSGLWCRIDEAQNYQSILSGKTKEDNGGRALYRHHVYWQKKACCVWDEDAQGYYAMINIGTAKKPNWHKHYIPGDPNKFVLLTAQEHGMVAKDKLKWIKIFEDLIETKLCGKCYLSKLQINIF